MSQETKAATKPMPRLRVLYTFGVSILAIGQKAYSRAKSMKGSIGKIANKVDNFLTSAFPFIYIIQDQGLAVLSFVDDQIVVAEDLIEALIPPSAWVFNKIDKLAHVVESLPWRFDLVMDKCAMIVHQRPFLNWTMAYFDSWLNCLIAILTHLGSKISREKEIEVNINNNESAPVIVGHLQEEIKKSEKGDQLTESPMSTSPRSCCSEESKTVTKCSYKEILESSSKAQNESSQDEIKRSGKEESPMPLFKSYHSEEFRTTMKCSYKEMLEKRGKESNDKRKEIIIEEEIGVRRELDVSKNKEKTESEDPILELFEASWHQSPGKGNPLARPIFDP